MGVFIVYTDLVVRKNVHVLILQFKLFLNYE